MKNDAQTSPLTRQEMEVLDMLDALSQAVYELPTVRPIDFEKVMLPAVVSIYNLITTAAPRRKEVVVGSLRGGVRLYRAPAWVAAVPQAWR